MSNDHRLGDQPIEPKYTEQMNHLARALDKIFNGEDVHGTDRKVGFVLLVFPFNEDFTGRCNFISNGADRKDIVTLFREMIARFEGQAETKGTA